MRRTKTILLALLCLLLMLAAGCGQRSDPLAIREFIIGDSVGTVEKRGSGENAEYVICITLPLSAVAYFLAPQIIALFAISGQAAAYCTQHLHLAAWAVLVFAVYFPCNGLLQGAGEGLYATACAALALGVRVALAYLLVKTALFGVAAIWWSQLLAWVVTLIFCYCHYFRGTWKTRSLVK